MVTPLNFISNFLANWYEERLAKEQVYRAKPDLRMVSIHLANITMNKSFISIYKILFID